MVDATVAMLNQALELHQAGQLEAAQVLYRRILQEEPSNVNALNLMGMLANQRDNHVEAERLVRGALRLAPQFPEAHLNLGIALEGQGQIRAAAASFQTAVALRPDLAEAHHNLGSALVKLERFRDAVESFSRAIVVRPRYSKAYFHKGNALQRLGMHAEAILSFNAALQITPRYAACSVNLGLSLKILGRLDEAIEAFEAVLKIDPSNTDALCNLGSALDQHGRSSQAIEVLTRAVSLSPGFAIAHYNLANALLRCDQLTGALFHFDRAIALNPDLPSAHFNRGKVLQKLEKFEAALTSYDASIALRPSHGESFSQRGVCLVSLGRFSEAIASYDLALREKPDWPDVIYNRGVAYAQSGRYRRAIEDFRKAILLEPNHDAAFGELWNTQQKICDWSEWSSNHDRLCERIASGGQVLSPFSGLVLPSLALQRRVVETWIRSAGLNRPLEITLPRHPNGAKLRIGYFSADFRTHALSLLMAGHFEAHDRTRFDLTAFSLGPQRDDALTRRVAAAFDRFVAVNEKSDEDVAQLARSHQIDIAIDLGGYTAYARPGIFRQRAAPIQVSYMGFPGTMGTQFHDYLIADKIVLPPSDQQHYTEKIAYLPDCYFATDNRRVVSTRVFSREACGLPPSGFVFCCFNGAYKLNPAIFDLWMRILKQVDDSVLWLRRDNDMAVDNLKREAKQRGVDPRRLIFATFASPPDHLARHQLADLFLDTLPYNAHTTATDALWAGVPVLTRPGDTFVGRTSASLLEAVGLPELIATSEEAYERHAVALGLDPRMMLGLKQKLRENIPKTALFDTERFCRNFEAALVTMFARFTEDRAIDHFHVG